MNLSLEFTLKSMKMNLISIANIQNWVDVIKNGQNRLKNQWRLTIFDGWISTFSHHFQSFY